MRFHRLFTVLNAILSISGDEKEALEKGKGSFGSRTSWITSHWNGEGEVSLKQNFRDGLGHSSFLLTKLFTNQILSYRQKKLEEDRKKKQHEREEAEKRHKLEIIENRARRAQLKESVWYFGNITELIERFKDESRRQNEVKCAV